MSDKMTFEEYKLMLDNIDESDRIYKITEDLLKNDKNKFPIFIGKINKDSIFGYYADNIHDTSGNQIEYPFQCTNKLRIMEDDGRDYQIGCWIAFTIKPGNFSDENHTLSIDLTIIKNPLGDSDFDHTLCEFLNKDAMKIIQRVVLNRDKHLEARLQFDLKEIHEELKKKNDEYTQKVNSCYDLTKKIEETAIELQAKQDDLQNTRKKLDHYKELGLYMSNYNELDKILGKWDSTPSNNEYSREVVNQKLKFNYEKNKCKVERFLMALNTEQIIVLCGKPGTGKTTFVSEMARAIGAVCTIIQVQSNWTDSMDLMGYYNPMQQIYNSTPFLDALIWAKKDYEEHKENAHLHIICLDEMNLAKVEYYFASFLSLLQLEKWKRNISLLPHGINKIVNNGLKLPEYEIDDTTKQLTSILEDFVDFELPPNVHFVGTLNMDETTNTLSPKVVDRSFFIEFMSDDGDEKKSLDEYSEANVKEYYSYTQFNPTDTEENDEFKFISNHNHRFKKYAQQMKSAFDKLKISDAEFEDLLVCSKILPTIKSSEDYKKFENDYGKYIDNNGALPLTYDRWGIISDRKPDDKTEPNYEDIDEKTYWNKIC